MPPSVYPGTDEVPSAEQHFDDMTEGPPYEFASSEYSGYAGNTSWRNMAAVAATYSGPKVNGSSSLGFEQMAAEVEGDA